MAASDPIAPHGDAHIGAGEYGRVVDAVAHKGEVAARGVEQLLDLADLVLGQQLRLDLVDAELACDCLGHLARSPVSMTQRSTPAACRS